MKDPIHFNLNIDSRKISKSQLIELEHIIKLAKARESDRLKPKKAKKKAQKS